MPIDPNIILQGSSPPKPLNALEMYGQMANIQNAQNQNKLFQAQRAAGGIAQQAVGPDGHFDRNQFNALLAKSPDAASYAFDALEHGNQIGTGQEGLTQAHVASANAEYGIMAPAVAALLADKSPLTFDKVSKVAAGVVGHPDYPGDWKSQFIQNTVGYLASMKQAVDQAGPDPKAQDSAIRGQLTELATRLENTRAQFNQISGQPMAVNTGAQTQIVAPSTVTGKTTQLGSMDNTLSPGEAASPVPVISGGVPSAITKGQFADAAGKGPVQVDYAPGVATGAQADAQANVAQAQALQASATGVPDRKAILKNMRAELPNFDTGPASKAHGFLGQLAAQFGVAGKDWEEAQSARESFSKLAYQIANTQRTALGGHGTDAQTEAAMHASPSDFLTRLGNEKVMALLSGNEDAIAAKNAAWQTYKQKHGPTSYDTFSAGFNRYYDPQAFQWSYMTPGQQSQVKADLTKHGEWSAFQQKLQFATKLKAMAGTE